MLSSLVRALKGTGPGIHSSTKMKQDGFKHGIGSIPCWQVAPSALSAGPERRRSDKEHFSKEPPDSKLLSETLSLRRRRDVTRDLLPS